MRIIVTAGPTREHIDSVRFITNASSGKMGYAIAAAAVAAGHEVTLLTGPVCLTPPAGCEVVKFISVADLKTALAAHFPAADAVIMTAAVGDFSVEQPFDRKLSRRGGPVTLHLVPTEDVIAAVGAAKRPDQTIIAFAVEDGATLEIEAKARAEMAAKHGDFVVVNTPSAMAADESYAAILSPTGIVLPWATRPKEELAKKIVELLDART